MEFLGTKGKWFVSSEYDEKWEQDTMQIGVENDNECIITCWSFHIEDEYKYNAQLIAHAPEMLEMLQKTEQWLRETQGHSGILEDIQLTIQNATTI